MPAGSQPPRFEWQLTHIPLFVLVTAQMPRGELWGSFLPVAFGALLVGSAATQPVPLTGSWEGQLLLNNNWRFMEADFGATGKLADAKVDLPQERRDFTEFSIDGQSVGWTLLRGQARMRFAGTREGDVIRGQAVLSDVVGEFQMVQTAAGKQRDTARHAGTYRTDAGGLITVARFTFGDGIDRLALLDVRRGYWGHSAADGPIGVSLRASSFRSFPGRASRCLQ
jgi:hypothetical protein